MNVDKPLETIEKALISSWIETNMKKFSETPKIEESKLDKITPVIMNKTLPLHPEFLPEIMEALHLHKFWKQLNNSNNHFVFKFLAEDRMLNFYEAACCGGFDINDIRIGMVVAAMTATLNTDVKVKNLPTKYSYIPCFQHSRTIDLSMFDLKAMEPTHIEEAEKLIKTFSNKTPVIKRMDPDNRLKVFLVDAFMMWTVSKNETLLTFLTREFNRLKYIPEDVLDRINVSNELGCGTMIGYKPTIDLTIFHTVWGRAKSFKYGIPTLVRELEKNSLKFN